MPRLSIVITATAGTAELETTLVSVLENRPHDSEVIVALGHPYADPYRLAGEVRFVPYDRHQSCDWSHLANTGILHATGEILNVLDAGVQVSESWTTRPLELFTHDDEVASIASIVMDEQDRRQIAAAGIEYRRSGRRRVRRETLALSRICDATPRPEIILGPTHAAAFYRRDALNMVGGEFPEIAGPLADVDVALSLAELGFLSLLEPTSVVVAPRHNVESRPWAEGRASEAVFWRHAAAMGWCGSLAAHVGSLCGEAMASVVRPKLARKLAGRTVSFCGVLSHLRHASRLQQQSRLADVSPTSLSIETARVVPAADAESNRSGRKAA